MPREALIDPGYCSPIQATLVRTTILEPLPKSLSENFKKNFINFLAQGWWVTNLQNAAPFMDSPEAAASTNNLR